MSKKNESKRMGWPGTILQRREPFEQSNGYLIPPREEAIGKYRHIVRTDPTVSACLEFVTMSILSRLGEYQHDNPKIKDFISLNFELLDGSFLDFCKELLSCLWAGFCVAEIVTEVRGENIWLHSLPVLPCETVVMHINEDTNSINYGRVNEIIQRPYQQAEARIPVEKCIIMRNYYAGSLASDPYGMSRLEPILHVWNQKERIKSDWVATLGKFATPLMKYKLYDSEAEVYNEATGETTKAYRVAAEQLKNWTNNNNGFIYGEGNDLDFIFPPSNIGDAFSGAVQYLDRLIMRGLLIPSLLFESGDVGSYALGSEHMELYQQGINAILLNLTETILEQLIRPLIVWNFGAQESWGFFNIKESKTEVASWSSVLLNMLQTGVIDRNNLDDLNFVRSRIGMDLLDELPSDMAPISDIIAEVNNG